MKLIAPCSQEELKSVLSYERRTGKFFWASKEPYYAKRFGNIAGSRDRDGYIKIMLCGTSYRAHHLAWFYVTGQWPVLDMDHKNRIRDDNRFSNLRLATPGQNSANTGPRKRSKSGVRGIYFSPKHGTWRAITQKNRKQIYIGSFSTKDEAVAAYNAAMPTIHGEFGI